jgi:hypothetical protein
MLYRLKRILWGQPCEQGIYTIKETRRVLDRILSFATSHYSVLADTIITDLLIFVRLR